MLQLYSYYRSSAAYRVRIALNLKALDWQVIPVNLLNKEQQGTDYKGINPQGLVPTLDTGQGLISQSLAIIEYLEECYPEPPLLPADTIARAQARSLAQLIAVDIHPLNNLRVLHYLREELTVAKPQELAWYHHWIAEGFTALESTLNRFNPKGPFCLGDGPGLVDTCLIPQVYNARRFGCDLNPYPRITHIAAHCGELPAFKNAAPKAQPDSPDA